jgi:hypothetical protein
VQQASFDTCLSPDRTVSCPAGRTARHRPKVRFH